jgi:hypothetical protein
MADELKNDNVTLEELTVRLSTERANYLALLKRLH